MILACATDSALLIDCSANATPFFVSISHFLTLPPFYLFSIQISSQSD